MSSSSGSSNNVHNIKLLVIRHHHSTIPGIRLQRRHTVMQPSMSIVACENGRGRVVINSLDNTNNNNDNNSGNSCSISKGISTSPIKNSTLLSGSSPRTYLSPKILSSVGMGNPTTTLGGRPRRSQTVSYHHSPSSRYAGLSSSSSYSGTNLSSSSSPSSATSAYISMAGSRPGNVLASHTIAASNSNPATPNAHGASGYFVSRRRGSI